MNIEKQAPEASRLSRLPGRYHRAFVGGPPCPFCGSLNLAVNEASLCDEVVLVVCGECSAQGPPVLIHGCTSRTPTPDEYEGGALLAIEEWTTRSPDNPVA
jgi:hypothetical protein